MLFKSRSRQDPEQQATEELQAVMVSPPEDAELDLRDRIELPREEPDVEPFGSEEDDYLMGFHRRMDQRARSSSS